jgi:tetratricopeptide (TPR) repeat protein
MPSTINGIGTWYYGQRNRFQRRGTCEHCGATADLKSYDTTLYFVFLHIPLVPISSKRVLDECSGCQKHKVLQLKEWNTLKDDSVTRANDAVEADPKNPVPLIEAIGVATGFQHLPQFEAFCEYAEESFPDNPDVLAAVAGGRMYFSQWDQASDLLERQLAIKPDDAVRRQLAVTLLKQLRPDDARPQLQHIFDGKLSDYSGFVWLLAEGYSAVGNHHEARDTLRALAEVDPAVVNDKEYKKRLAAAEKLAAKGSTKMVASTLLGSPKGASYKEGSRFQISRWIGPVVILSLVSLYFWSAISNGQARQVWVVSGLPVPYTATIGGVEVPLQPFTRVKRSFPEGTIPVAVADPKLGVEATVVDIRTNFFARPFLSPTFIINPDRAALVMWEKAHYAANPADVTPNEHKLASNRVLHEFWDINHVFENFPDQIKVKGNSGSRTRVATIGPPEFTPDLMALAAVSMLGPGEGQSVVWRWANAQPDNDLYLAMVANPNQGPGVADKLKPRLTDRPVLVEWHRSYQTLKQQDPGLVAEYEALLAKEPENGDLAYLLGRIVVDNTREQELFQRAANGQPPSAYAWNALALSSLSRGEFQQGLEQSEKARALLPDRRGFALVYEDACLALGDWKRLLHLYEHGGQSAPRLNNTMRSPRELQFLIWDGNGEAAEQLRRQIQMAAQGTGMVGDDLARNDSELESALRIARGDWEWVEKHAAEPAVEPGFQELLLLRRWPEAAATLEGGSGDDVATSHLLLAMLAGAAGEDALATTQHLLGVKALSESNRNYQPFARVFDVSGTNPSPTNAELIAASLRTAEKCVLLAAVAKTFPDRAAELLPLAKKLNFHRDLQAHLMDGVLGKE